VIDNPCVTRFTGSPTLDRLDRGITRAMADYGLVLMRIALGVVFLWFGVLKFFPGLSPAEGLAGRTIETLTLNTIPYTTAVFILAIWESVIGLGLLTGRFMRATLFLLFLQMLGTLTPLVLFPNETFGAFPYAPTLEGQYIIKNAVLVAGAVILGATVRGGRIVPEPVPTGDIQPHR
jgi:uncharacterized membrane protein YphA (DoxX/SURF4 family)